MKTIVLTGGGTGGHVIPHLSLLPLIKKDFNNIHYIGSENGIEKEIISKHSELNYHSIPTVKLERKFTFKNFAIPFKLISAINKAKKLLKTIKPNVVFSKGGFVSVPVVIAAKKLKIPVVSHESDLSMGLANKIIYKFCNAMCTTFEKTANGKKRCVFTGSPIRTELFYGNKEKLFSTLPISRNKKTILFMGGSTGALRLNEVLYQTLPKLTETYNIIHIVGKGKGNINIKFDNYCQIEFTHNIEDFFAISDLIISRAGSNAICEFLALKKPMLLIPLPKNASRGDQIENANLFKQLGYANVLPQEELSSTRLEKEIKLLEENSSTLINNMKKAKNENGSQNIYNIIKKYTN